jgi:hypothetical protein
VHTILGFSLGFLALGAFVAVVEVLMMIFTIALAIYGSLALIGVVVFSVIGIRRRIARRRGQHADAQVPEPAWR